jgi:hypothetical protein
MCPFTKLSDHEIGANMTNMAAAMPITTCRIKAPLGFVRTQDLSANRGGRGINNRASHGERESLDSVCH